MVNWSGQRKSEAHFTAGTQPVPTQRPVHEPMTALKSTALRLIVLLVFQTLCLATVHAQRGASPKPAADPRPAADPKITEQIKKQEAIYQGKGEQLLEGYVIDRSLLSYATTLSPEFDHSLASLGPNDRWLDIGAGMGLAILDYYTPRYDSMHPEGRERRGKKARAVAISIEDRRTPLWQETAAGLEENQIQYLFSRRLREYSLKELGRFQVITDVIGGFSYTTDLSLFMEKTLGFLEVNGSFFTLLQDVHSEAGTNKPHYANSPYLTEITAGDGSKMKVCSWLKSISCVEVSCELRMDWKPPIEVYRIQKVCDNVSVPALVNIHYEAGTPPERAYRLATPKPVSLASPAPAAPPAPAETPASPAPTSATR